MSDDYCCCRRSIHFFVYRVGIWAKPNKGAFNRPSIVSETTSLDQYWPSWRHLVKQVRPLCWRKTLSLAFVMTNQWITTVAAGDLVISWTNFVGGIPVPLKKKPEKAFNGLRRNKSSWLCADRPFFFRREVCGNLRIWIANTKSSVRFLFFPFLLLVTISQLLVTNWLRAPMALCNNIPKLATHLVWTRLPWRWGLVKTIDCAACCCCW